MVELIWKDGKLEKFSVVTEAVEAFEKTHPDAYYRLVSGAPAAWVVRACYSNRDDSFAPDKAVALLIHLRGNK